MAENQFDEFSKENKLHKLLKAGKITKKEYDQQIDKMDRRYEY